MFGTGCPVLNQTFIARAVDDIKQVISGGVGGGPIPVIPGVSTDAEASAKQTAELLDTIKRENVKAIFAEQSVNPQLATSLANDAGVKIVDDLYGDSLGESGSGAATVDGMLLYNARKISDALK